MLVVNRGLSPYIPTWFTIATYTLDADGTGEENASYRVVVPSLSRSITKVRITVEAPAGALTCHVDNCSIGVRSGSTEDTTATPTEILFSAASGFSIATGATLLSDELTFSASGGSDLLVVFDIASSQGNVRYSTSTSYNMYRATGANTYATADVTMTLNGAGIHAAILQKIEGFG